MSDSNIGWTNKVWNPVTGCDKVSAGCKNCYAETFSERFRGVKGHPFEQGFDLKLWPDRLAMPLHWRKPRMVFVNSMSDLFHEDVPEGYIDKVFAVMAMCPEHKFQILTKRAERMRDWATMKPHRFVKAVDRLFWEHSVFADRWSRLRDPERHRFLEGDFLPLPNVWLGVSCENQETANERIPLLLQTPTAVRWVSAEPLLGPTNLQRLEFPVTGPGSSQPAAPPSARVINALTGYDGSEDHKGRGAGYVRERLSWVVVGGESGSGRRECEPEWINSIVDQCKAASVPCFVKQDSGLRPGKQGRLSDEVWSVKEFPR